MKACELVSRWAPVLVAGTDIAAAVTRAYQKAEQKDEQSAVGSAVDWVAASDWSRAAWKAVSWAVKTAVWTVYLTDLQTAAWMAAATAAKSVEMSDTGMVAESVQASAAQKDDQTD